MLYTTRRTLLISTTVATLLLGIVATPALAIRNGSLDGNAHPYVGIMVAKDADGNPLWRCSGTLISPTVFVTAGHCTESPAETAEIWFRSDMTNNAVTGYPNNGDYSGTTYTHPDYDPDFFVYRDLGLVILDEPAVMPEYATLPELNSLDSLKPSNTTTFTSVGYGRQRSFPDAAAWKNEAIKQRMVAHPQLKQINSPNTGDFALLLVANASDGGTCFGDSGGPNFLGDTNVLAAVTSFGWNRTCAGTSGVFRLDRSWSLAFINDAADGIMGDDYDGGNS